LPRTALQKRRRNSRSRFLGRGRRMAPTVTTEIRRAQNEALFREVNERIEEISGGLAEGDQQPEELRLVCECGRQECAELLEATVAEYEAVRSNPRCFLVLAGHEQNEIERVIERNSRFFVVEKYEEAGEVATEHDPRS
jgi:hypothetical protein